jgi:hypothetical protein
MDLHLSPVPANTVYLTFNNLGGDNSDWSQLKAGSKITLRHGQARQEVVLQYRPDSESFHSSLEINPATAKRLKLRGLMRYAASYDERTGVMTLAPSPLSRAPAVLRGGATSGHISIGYELQCALGIPERARLAVTCRYGTNQRRLTVRTPSNLFDRSFRLTGSDLRTFGLKEGTAVALLFDQRTLTLTLLRPPSSSAGSRKNPSAAKAT